MHSTTRPIPILRFLLPAALLLAGCDRGDALETTEPLDDRAAEAAPAVDEDAPPREHAHHGGNGNKLERLCEMLACTDDQRARIEGLAARLWAERPEPAGDRDAANRALAQAFDGETFSAADLQAFRKAAGPDVDEVDAMLVEAVVELHGILDAEQRATLADKIEHKGLPFVGGRGGKHHGKRKRGDDDRGGRMAQTLCEAVACTEDQRAEITALVQARPEPGQVPQAERQALAAAFRGPTLSDEPVDAYLDAAAKVRAEDQAAFEAHVVRLHGLLTPQQRAELARRIAEDGPRALGMPGKGHHGKQGRQGKQGRRGPDGAAAQQFG